MPELLLPDWSLGALLLLGLGLLWGAIRWLKSRLEGGLLTVISQSGSQLRRRIKSLEGELAAERHRRVGAETCAECAACDRDAAQERVIALQQAWIQELRDDADTSGVTTLADDSDPRGGSDAAAQRPIGWMRRR